MIYPGGDPPRGDVDFPPGGACYGGTPGEFGLCLPFFGHPPGEICRRRRSKKTFVSQSPRGISCPGGFHIPSVGRRFPPGTLISPRGDENHRHGGTFLRMIHHTRNFVFKKISGLDVILTGVDHGFDGIWHFSKYPKL